jgi:predicted CoA-substrate-specific enzyme activase
MGENVTVVAGVDVGAECVKAIVLDSDRRILGRTVVPTRGYFQDRVREALDGALDEAQVTQAGLAGICATGFGHECVDFATMNAGDMVCHAQGAFHYFPHSMSIVDIGGRDPRVIRVASDGRPEDIYTLRRCAMGIGTFLMFAARHLDVHPTRLQELAAAVDKPASVGSYCSVFAGSDVLELLRGGETREAVALGCMHSIAERIVEIGGFSEPLRVTGGVAEYFPGVIKVFSEITELKAEAIPEPIQAGAVGAALLALRGATGNAAPRAGG